MVIQDMVKQYGRKHVKPNCLMKNDLQRPYDTVNWEFWKEMVQYLDFPQSFIELVMQSVTTPKFSLMINGSMKGFFMSSRGLRQGDPMSLLLFVICMKYLSRILMKMIELEQFKFHHRCKEIRLTHMCFEHDLILCCKGDYDSVVLMLRAFKLFSETSSLKVNVNKSAMYTCGMPDIDVTRIAAISGLSQQALPFKFLGVPICAKKISAAQCEALIDKMTGRIRVWSSRNMSYTARTLLINSVLSSLHSYWDQAFVLPRLLYLPTICSRSWLLYLSL
ncbi:uncharacterized protein LOC125492336 [Beta vulgaris subsp. vulgaris]|uniref:uncharacterized protein LOC125492336 n=1 Tax=Beta vulgaris subsp. vulgaris TaxID=3555 RepID=UPI002036737B|nr:uncharacterized protein LOC125492336 [Beta vulgaris subsp. vulgaris]